MYSNTVGYQSADCVYEGGRLTGGRVCRFTLGDSAKGCIVQPNFSHWAVVGNNIPGGVVIGGAIVGGTITGGGVVEGVVIERVVIKRVVISERVVIECVIIEGGD